MFLYILINVTINHSTLINFSTRNSKDFQCRIQKRKRHRVQRKYQCHLQQIPVSLTKYVHNQLQWMYRRSILYYIARNNAETTRSFNNFLRAINFCYGAWNIYEQKNKRILTLPHPAQQKTVSFTSFLLVFNIPNTTEILQTILLKSF